MLEKALFEDTICFMRHEKDIEATERLTGMHTSCLSVLPLCMDLSSQILQSPETCNQDVYEHMQETAFYHACSNDFSRKHMKMCEYDNEAKTADIKSMQWPPLCLHS